MKHKILVLWIVRIQVRKSALNVIVSPCHANAAGVPMHILRAAGRPVVETRAEHAQR